MKEPKVDVLRLRNLLHTKLDAKSDEDDDDMERNERGSLAMIPVQELAITKRLVNEFMLKFSELNKQIYSAKYQTEQVNMYLLALIL